LLASKLQSLLAEAAALPPPTAEGGSSTRPENLLAADPRALKLASLFGEYDMILPAAPKERPYAPVERDAGGRVIAYAGDTP
jgi:hypothetical protein